MGAAGKRSQVFIGLPSIAPGPPSTVVNRCRRTASAGLGAGAPGRPLQTGTRRWYPAGMATYQVVAFDLRAAPGRARRPEDPGPGRYRPPYRSGPDARRPLRKRRLPRRQGLSGQDGGSHPPARGDAGRRRGGGQGARPRRWPRASPFACVTSATRRSSAYLVGSIEEREPGTLGDLARFPARPGPDGQASRGDRDLRSARAGSSKSRSSPSVTNPPGVGGCAAPPPGLPWLNCARLTAEEPAATMNSYDVTGRPG